MKLKTYKLIQIGMVIISAVLISQAIIFKNFIIPIAVLIIAALVLLLLRNKVKEIIADERDYAIGGKASLLSIQIFSWVTVMAILFFYTQKETNSIYEPVGMALAFSVCFLMLVYSLLFRLLK